MKGFVKILLVFVIGILSCDAVLAQSKKELEAKKAKIQKEIEQTNNQLKQVSKNKNATKEQIAALKKKIALRQSLITTINSEINEIGSEIATTSNEITNLETKLGNLKEDYTKLILYADKNKNVYQRLMFVFAASDFNQAYQRMKMNSGVCGISSYASGRNYCYKKSAEWKENRITAAGRFKNAVKTIRSF